MSSFRAPSLLVLLPLLSTLALSQAPVVPVPELDEDDYLVVDEFALPDQLYHGDRWESLNPGYWKIESGALRRRLENVGDHRPTTSFPWHWSQGGKEIAPVEAERDPSLPLGMIWRRDWRLTGNFAVRVEAVIRDVLAVPEEERRWRNEQPGYAFLGVCFGGESLFESRNWKAKPGDGSWMALLRDDGTVGVYDHARGADALAWEGGAIEGSPPQPGEPVTLEVFVHGEDEKLATVTARWTAGGETRTLQRAGVDRARFTDGNLGLVARGRLDFEVQRVLATARDDRLQLIGRSELHVAYPLGDTLQRNADGAWQCRFLALFRNPGDRVEIRIADRTDPEGGWAGVPIAGTGRIVDNTFRHYTAVVEVMLPGDPSEQTFHYTVWKDGLDVTADPRYGFLGRKEYVGRLPRLAAPYRVCTLGGHAIHAGRADLPEAGTYQRNWIHGQPSMGAYQHFEAYDFQIINWDDDVWYLELLFPPPSTDDAYKIITLTLANPTTRWQMMRHWNVINPGDHDYGMDDVKGPEQRLVRLRDDLGQDSEYMRRNFDLVRHLVRGIEEPTGAENPKDWRRWTMPDGDFSLYILDPRLWRSSQDTDLWVNTGWGKRRALYDRTDPTRTLLGEEQFAWFSERIHTDAAPLVCVSGINCLHPIFTGGMTDEATGFRFANLCRIAADYSGWVKAGADRVIELLGSRSGVVSVYGDIHLASLVQNVEHRFVEASCGPIGRTGSRGLIRGFGPRMKDVDGRDVEVIGLYHDRYDSPAQHPREKDRPQIWNFLELEFDPRGAEPRLGVRIRHIEDPPDAEPRGGGLVDLGVSETGRRATASLPPIATLPEADVRFSRLDGTPLRATRSLPDGTLPLAALPDVSPGTRLLVTATRGQDAEAMVVETGPLRER